ncbi:hypothetical protein KAX17_17020, partial [Candidatus Bipolaricaulota bacterium]|nr:hypothetical protein [Candidatus Bipolaricaulota bacterium]
LLVIQQRLADLRVEMGFTFEPKPPVSSGEPVKVYGAIVNDGGTLAEDFRAVFHCLKREDDMVCKIYEFDVTSIDSLAPGERLEIMGVLDTTDLLGGTYEICLVADPDNAVPESDEDNNAYCTPPAFVLLAPPDLQPICRLSYDPTPPVMANTAVALLAEIANTGGSPSGPFDVEFSYRHIKRGITGVVTKVAPSIPPGKAIEIRADLNTTDLPIGIYELCVTVDKGKFIEETDETNNTFCVPSLVLISQPDLKAEPELRIETPLPVMAGETVTITGWISNIGGLRANRSLVHFQYRDLDSGTVGPPVAKELAPVLPRTPPVKVIWELDTTGFQAGAYEICMVADGPDLLPELDETNNRICIPYLVLVSEPDLTVEELDFKPDPPLAPGKEATVIATVTNIGGSSAGKSILRFSCRPVDGGDEVEYEDDVHALAPGESTVVKWILGTTEMSGAYAICAEIDPENFIEELDEENNFYCTPPPFIVIGPLAGRADLVPTNLKIKPWTTLQLTALTSVTITNRGEEPAGPFDVY